MSFDKEFVTRVDKELTDYVAAQKAEFDKSEFVGEGMEGKIKISFIKPGRYSNCILPDVTEENRAAVQEAVAVAADSAYKKYEAAHDDLKKRIQDHVLKRIMEIGKDMVEGKYDDPLAKGDVKLSDELEDKLNFVKRLTQEDSEPN